MIKNIIPLERHDCINGRFYSNADGLGKEKIYHPSVTTILNIVAKGDNFDRWLGGSNSYEDAMEYAHKKAAIGTVVHMVLEYLLANPKSIIDIEEIIASYNESNYPRIPKSDVKNVARCIQGSFEFFNSQDLTVEALELKLWDRKLPFSGTADLICRIKNKDTGKSERWLIDFKTGRENPEVQLQLTFYKRLFCKIYKKRINRIGALYLNSRWIKKPTYTLREYDYIPLIAKNTLELYRWKYGKDNKMPQPRFPKKFPTIFSFNKIKGVYSEWTN